MAAEIEAARLRAPAPEVDCGACRKPMPQREAVWKDGGYWCEEHAPALARQQNGGAMNGHLGGGAGRTNGTLTSGGTRVNGSLGSGGTR